MALQDRPPIITIMGHVDHGKTTLLDFIRKTNVQAKEAGGITQHIGAYQVEHQGKKITFIDTPGHAAFNKMRQRGAQITDIIILVVAANDGVKPQTIESIRYIKESSVPFIVAINKTDLEGVRVDDVKAQLAEQAVLVRGFGGEVEVVELSAKTGKNVEKLLDVIAVMAELAEFKADPQAPLEAVVIESARDPHKGPIADVIVQQGTLTRRQDVMAGTIKGRVKLLTNELGKQLKEVLPGYPAEVVGLEEAPEVGMIIRADGSAQPKPAAAPAPTTPVSTTPAGWEGLDIDQAFGGKVKLNLLVKADVKGTLEAILQNIDQESVNLVFSGVGQVTEQEVELADATKAMIIAFSLKVPTRMKTFAKDLGVKIKEYQIIYHLIEDLQKQMLKILEPTIDEIVTGEAELVQIFEMRGERIAGVRVKTGEIKKSDLLHLKRADEILFNPVIAQMKHGKDDILVAKAKSEAGLTFKNKKLDFQVGDMIVAYQKEE
ncbi:MAG: Translation initiation factor IF-2 [Candidatus Pacebacteria bacterium GW2011_GWA1_46_10]|nr:MAG: Translation initiation factor IF-2 [Candidatus Pacebacteria bacterium GW2011_GWA1_46_10]